jgi:hypothetical protein
MITETPETSGMYRVTLQDGTELRAWYSRANSHWLAENKMDQLGFGLHLQLPGSGKEQSIIDIREA